MAIRSKTENHFRYRTDAEYCNSVFFLSVPTYNCQLSCIGEAAYLFNLSREKAFAELNCWYKTCMQPILLMDVKRCYRNKLEDWFKGYIIMIQNYTSTNKSSMTIALINIKDLK